MWLLGAVGLILVVTLSPQSGANAFEPWPLADIWPAISQPWHPLDALGVLGNLLLFAPLGASLRLRGVPRRRSVLAALGLSVAIELLQLAIPGRTTATDDVILNTLGAAAGWELARRFYAREM